MENKLLSYLSLAKTEIENLNFYQDAESNKSLLIAFRGESKDYGKTKLMPSLFRDVTFVSKEKYLFELICDYGMIDSASSNIEKAIETQHYVEISRMLDITFNLLLAVFFACYSKDNLLNDGNLYIFGFPEDYSPHSGYVEEFYTKILNDDNNTSYARNFKVFTHSYSNERIKAQKGGFIFFPGNEFLPISDVYYSVITIQANDKPGILKELDLMFQINEATVFPEKDKIAMMVKEKFLRKQYISKKVTLLDEVEIYFDRMQYEISSPKFKKISKVDYQRYLRKEKSDLISYLNAQITLNSQDFRKIMKAITEEFKMLEIIYEGEV